MDFGRSWIFLWSVEESVKAKMKENECPVLNLFVRMKVPSMANQRLHWAAKHRQVKKQRQLVHTQLLLNFGRQHYEKPTVKLIRVGRPLDSDNLASALKAVRDGVADYLQMLDDSDKLITWQYAQWPGSPQGVRVEIRPAGGKK